jgi:hypothetical protein
MCENLRKNVGRKLHLICLWRSRMIVVENMNLQHWFLVVEGIDSMGKYLINLMMMAALGSAVNVAYSVWQIAK